MTSEYEDVPLPPPLDWDSLAKGRPRTPSQLMEGLPRGKPTGVFGDGGLGKSYIELTRAVCLATGRPFFGIPMNGLTESVLYLSCDDSEDDLHFRLVNIRRYLDVNMASTREDVDLDLDVLDMTETDPVLFDPRASNGPLTPAYYRLRRFIRDRGVTTLFIDGIANTFAGNENDRGEVTRYVTAMHNLVRDPDRYFPQGTVVLIGHVNKVTAGNPATSQGFSGSTAFNNRVRNRWFVRPEVEGGHRTGKIIYELQKTNAGEVGTQMEFEWSDAHQMFVGRKRDSQSDHLLRQDVDMATAIRNALKGCTQASPPIIVPAAMTGPNTAYHVLSRRPEFPAELRRDTPQARRRFNALLRDLREKGHIEETPYARAHRKVGRQIVLTEEGLRQCG